jgi:hypothetical protein
MKKCVQFVRYFKFDFLNDLAELREVNTTRRVHKSRDCTRISDGILIGMRYLVKLSRCLDKLQNT